MTLHLTAGSRPNAPLCQASPLQATALAKVHICIPSFMESLHKGFHIWKQEGARQASPLLPLRGTENALQGVQNGVFTVAAEMSRRTRIISTL